MSKFSLRNNQLQASFFACIIRVDDSHLRPLEHQGNFDANIGGDDAHAFARSTVLAFFIFLKKFRFPVNEKILLCAFPNNSTIKLVSLFFT